MLVCPPLISHSQAVALIQPKRHLRSRSGRVCLTSLHLACQRSAVLEPMRLVAIVISQSHTLSWIVREKQARVFMCVTWYSPEDPHSSELMGGIPTGLRDAPISAQQPRCGGRCRVSLESAHSCAVLILQYASTTSRNTASTNNSQCRVRPSHRQMATTPPCWTTLHWRTSANTMQRRCSQSLCRQQRTHARSAGVPSRTRWMCERVPHTPTARRRSSRASRVAVRQASSQLDGTVRLGQNDAARYPRGPHQVGSD